MNRSAVMTAAGLSMASRFSSGMRRTLMPMSGREGRWSLILGASLLVGMSQALAAGDAGPAIGKVETCLGCHGIKDYVNVYPTYKVPRIAGQSEAYLVAALKGYRDGTREHETMQANAALLSDEDIEEVAAWFASQGSQKPRKSSDVTLSEGHPATTCAACHAADGNSEIPQNPILAGQHASYLENSLKSYRSGARQNAVMAGFAQNLSDDDISELAEWFSSKKSVLETAPR